MPLPPRTQPVDRHYHELMTTLNADEQYELDERAAIKQYEGNISQEFAESQAAIEGMLKTHKNNKEDVARDQPLTWFSTVWRRCGIDNASMGDVIQALAEGKTTATALAKAYLARIEAYDRGGPALNSVRELNPEALAIVDGTGRHAAHGAHYSRRTPGSKTFTGVGREVVLVTSDGCAVWACVYQRTPGARGLGGARGRSGAPDPRPRYIFRNMIFRNLGAGRSSDLIREALIATKREWIQRYGAYPLERLRTEIGIAQVRSSNPGYCYKMAGWTVDRIVRGKLYLWAPDSP